MPGRDVVGRYIAAPRSASERHRRLEISSESNCAVSRRAVYDHPRCGHSNSIFTRRIPALGVDRSCVTHSSVSEDLGTSLAAFLQTVDDIIRKNWRKLLH